MIHDPLNNDGCENVISCKKKIKSQFLCAHFDYVFFPILFPSSNYVGHRSFMQIIIESRNLTIENDLIAQDLKIKVN